MKWNRIYLLICSWILKCVRQAIVGILVNSIFNMWRMAIFIRHICGKRKNTLGHRWYRPSICLNEIYLHITKYASTWACAWCVTRRAYPNPSKNFAGKLMLYIIPVGNSEVHNKLAKEPILAKIWITVNLIKIFHYSDYPIKQFLKNWV